MTVTAIFTIKDVKKPIDEPFFKDLQKGSVITMSTTLSSELDKPQIMCIRNLDTGEETVVRTLADVSFIMEHFEIKRGTSWSLN